MRLTSKPTITAQRAFSTGRVLVSVLGDEQHLKSFWGGTKINKASENKHKNRKEAVYIM